MLIERLSIELTNRCDKGCGFCYNQSQPGGGTLWTVDEIITLVKDCVTHGLRAVSFGGGEPLQYEGLHEILEALQGVLFRSVTSNGLLLTDASQFERLVAAKPDKVHISIHKPSSEVELDRVIATVLALDTAGIPSGINLLVAADQLDITARAAQKIRDAGISNQRIVYLPQRSTNTPTPKDVAKVAGGPFQSMSCLSSCATSPRFCSLSWDRSVAWCSYTSARHALTTLSYAGLTASLEGLGLINCAIQTREESKPISLMSRMIKSTAD
jgi:organic radical activating enzyme